MNDTNQPIDRATIEAAYAANRPKLTPVEASRRRAESLKRFKKFEYILFAVLVVVLVFIQFRLFDAFNAGVSSDVAFSYIMAYLGALMVYAALMLRQGTLRVKRDDETISKDADDHFFRGWRLTWFAPLVALLLLIPALSTGMFNEDGMNAWGAGALFTLLIAAAFLMSALFAVFILVPLEFIIRGIVGLIRGDKSKGPYVVAGLAIAGLTAFIFIGATAIETTLPYPVGSGQAFLAMLGIPGGYYVNSEPLLWLARGIFIFYVALFIGIRRVAKRDKAAAAAKASTDTDTDTSATK